MSRHRNLQYDLDDYYDDYYDDDDYYEGEGNEEGDYTPDDGGKEEAHDFGRISLGDEEGLLEMEAPPPAPAAEEPDRVTFIQEILAKHPNTRTGGPSEKRVKSILDAYDNDVERTLAYFEEQLSKDPAKLATPNQKQQKSKKGGGSGMQTVSSSNTLDEMAGDDQFDASMPTTPAWARKKMTIVVPEPPGTPITPGNSGGKRSRSLSADEYTLVKSLPSNLRHQGLPLSPTTPPAQQTPASLSGTPPRSPMKGRLPKKSDGLPHVSVVLAGHVDAGKSTLVGQLLNRAGLVAQAKLRKYSKESEASGKGSFFLAWVMDESASEREHGVTIGIAERNMTTTHRHITLLDAPGHRDFIPNMISGASHADAALLVVSAAPGEFESSMSLGAQTREHALILKAIGVEEVVVAVNKMDRTVPIAWDEARFDQVCAGVLTYLTSLKFSRENITFLPVSGVTGENVCNESSSCPAPWYIGPSMLEMLDSLKEPARPVERAVRAVITAALSNLGGGSDAGNKAFVASARVVQGRLRKGRGVGLAPTAGVADIQKIVRSDGEEVNILFPGECGDVWLVDRAGRSVEEMALWSGMILYKGPPAVMPCIRFKATILTTDALPVPLLPGSMYSLYLHGEELQCRIRKIYRASKAAIATGASSSATEGGVRVVKKPKSVGRGSSALVQIQVERPICIEPFAQCRMLGRFALRMQGVTCAVGVCEAIRVKDHTPSAAR